MFWNWFFVWRSRQVDVDGIGCYYFCVEKSIQLYDLKYWTINSKNKNKNSECGLEALCLELLDCAGDIYIIIIILIEICINFYFVL